MRTQGMKTQDMLGKRVTYFKGDRLAGREGWQGTITAVYGGGSIGGGYETRGSFEVLWDQRRATGEGPVKYRLSTLSRLSLRAVQRAKVDIRRPGEGYIYLTGEDDYRAGEDDVPRRGAHTYIIVGENGGQPRKVYFDWDADAEAELRRSAANSKSGQAYLLFKPVKRAQRQDPPIVVTDVQGDA